VPHLVAFREVMEDSVIQKAMGIGEQPDLHSRSYRQAWLVPKRTATSREDPDRRDEIFRSLPARRRLAT
jgi:hypothetical protein